MSDLLLEIVTGTIIVSVFSLFLIYIFVDGITVISKNRKNKSKPMVNKKKAPPPRMG